MANWCGRDEGDRCLINESDESDEMHVTFGR